MPLTTGQRHNAHSYGKENKADQIDGQSIDEIVFFALSISIEDNEANEYGDYYSTIRMDI